MSSELERAPSHETMPEPPRIYVASLSDYNDGNLHGAWIDATLELAELNARIQQMLASSPTTPAAEEYAVHDYDGFGHYRVGEYDSISWVHAVAAGITEHGLAFAAWAGECDHDIERLERFEDAFLGEYESATAYADDLLDGVGLQHLIDEHVPESLHQYVTIDASGLARDLQLGGDITVIDHENGVWIFDAKG